MKQITLLALMLGMSVGAFAQTEQEPCCGIVGINPATNTITGWNKTTGRLFQFKVNAADIKAVKLNNTVNASPQLDRITNLNGGARNYSVLKYFAAPINDVKIQGTTALPVGLINLQIDNEEPVTEIISIQIDNAEPIAESVGKPRINNAEPVGIITAKNKLTGKTFQFIVPAAIAKTLKVGDPAYLESVTGITPINDFAIVQSSYGSSSGQMNSYGYGATSGDNTNTNKGTSSDKWVITPVATMKGVLGGLDINFPGVDRDILIYRPTDNKFITSVSNNAKSYTIAPGEYRFTLTNVPVDNVPIKKAHITRLKAGYLNIVSEGKWHLYDDTKKKAFTSGNKPKKLALPVGSYQLKLGLDFYPVLIKDGKTVEY